MTMNDNIKKLIIKRAGADEIRKTAEVNGMINLRADGINKARDGMTTLDEVIRETTADTLD